MAVEQRRAIENVLHYPVERLRPFSEIMAVFVGTLTPLTKSRVASIPLLESCQLMWVVETWTSPQCGTQAWRLQSTAKPGLWSAGQSLPKLLILKADVESILLILRCRKSTKKHSKSLTYSGTRVVRH